MPIVSEEKVVMNLAKLKKDGNNYEVAIDPDEAVNFKHDKADIRDALKVEEIFSDAKKGIKSSRTHLKEVFGTDDILDVAAIIIKTGIIQSSEDHRSKLRSEKERRIIALISRLAVDPRTRIPHPAIRIENAMEEVKIKVDDKKSAEDQIAEIVKKLQTVLPIKLEVHTYELIIPMNVAPKCVPIIKNMGTVKKEDWQDKYFCQVEIPAGLQNEFFDKLNELSHGGIQSKLI